MTVALGGRTLLNSVDFTARCGELTAVVGPNGAGKTTLLRALSGVLAPSAGTVHLDGVAPQRLGSAQRARIVTLLSSDAVEPDAMSVRDVVTVARYAHHPWWDWRRTETDADAVEEALRRVGLAALAERSIGTLSSGERSRVWLALALAQGAGTLLLDEPTSHLDVRFAHDVLRLLRSIARSGATVVAVLHDLSEAAAYADRVALLAAGRVLCYGEPRAALSTQALQSAYGVPFDAVETASGYRVWATAAPHERA